MSLQPLTQLPYLSLDFVSVNVGIRPLKVTLIKRGCESSGNLNPYLPLKIPMQRIKNLKGDSFEFYRKKEKPKKIFAQLITRAGFQIIIFSLFANVINIGPRKESWGEILLKHSKQSTSKP